MAKNSPPRAVSSGAVSTRDWGMAALVVCATFIAYLPSLSGDFIWNDSDYVTAPTLRSLSGLWQIWTQPGVTEQYYPLLHSAFWVQHLLWGDHTLPYHLVTLLLHAGSAVLFALVLRRLFDGETSPAASTKGSRSKVAAAEPAPRRCAGAEWIAALIFALHPVHVESVAWITEQKNTLSLIFYLLAALTYLRYDQTRLPGPYYLALGWFVISLLCKTVTASLPAALLVAFWWRRGRLEWRRDFQPLIPWLLIGAGVGLFTSWVEQHYLGAKGQDFNLPFLSRGLIAGRAVWFYLGKFVWPFDLNFIYPRWVPDASSGWQWLYPLGVLALTAGLWAVRRRTRAPLAAFLFFVGSLFPVLGFVNLYGSLYSFVWDHWQYLPDLGLAALAGTALVQAWAWTSIRLNWAGPALAVVLAGFLGALAWDHCGMFHDDQVLFHTTLARNSAAWMAHFNLGGHLSKTPGHEAEAVPEFEAALRINPDLPDAHYNLGTILSRIPGRLPEGISHFEAAVRLAPDNAAIRYNFGNVLLRIPERLPDAIVQYREAVRINPGMAEAQYNLGIALIQDPALVPEAITHFEAALKINPDFPLAQEIMRRWRAGQR